MPLPAITTAKPRTGRGSDPEPSKVSAIASGLPDPLRSDPEPIGDLPIKYKPTPDSRPEGCETPFQPYGLQSCFALMSDVPVHEFKRCGSHSRGDPHPRR